MLKGPFVGCTLLTAPSLHRLRQYSKVIYPAMLVASPVSRPIEAGKIERPMSGLLLEGLAEPRCFPVIVHSQSEY